MDRVDDLGVVDPTQVRRRDLEVCMPEQALYDEQRDPSRDISYVHGDKCIHTI
jgi:hypothetical protein